MVQALTAADMKKRLPEEGKRKVDASLAARLGVALYKDGDGKQYLVSYGRGGDIGYSNPPSNYGSSRLIAYCSPQQPALDMVSPLLRNREEWPQTSAPPRGPARTVYQTSADA
jgi:hypothetical protein